MRSMSDPCSFHVLTSEGPASGPPVGLLFVHCHVVVLLRDPGATAFEVGGILVRLTRNLHAVLAPFTSSVQAPRSPSGYPSIYSGYM